MWQTAAIDIVLAVLAVYVEAQINPYAGVTIRGKTRFYDPHYGYKQYWPGGEWILYGDAHTKEPTTTGVQVCDDECSEVYKPIKEICARWSSENTLTSGCNPSYIASWFVSCGNNPPDVYAKYKTFNSYCEYLAEDCFFNKWNGWVYVHMGPCIKNVSDYFRSFNFASYVVDRKKKYVADLTERLSKYEFVPFEPSNDRK